MAITSLFARAIAASLFAALIGTSASAAPPQSPFSSCINLSNALEAPVEGEWGYTIRDEDIIRIAEAGFDAVRVPIRWSAHAQLTAPYTIDPAFFARVDHVVEQSLAAGLHVVINTHHFDAFVADPDGQTERFLAIWEQIAQRYAAHSDRLIFEFLNEPHTAVTLAKMEALNPRLIETVRRSNPDRWLVIGGANWGSLGGLLKMEPPQGHRLMATFHYYAPFNFTHQGAEFLNPTPPVGVEWGDEAEHFQIADDMARAALFGRHYGLPVFLGEFGTYHEANGEERNHWIGHVRQEAEANGLSWCHWGWAMRFGVYDDESETWIEPTRRALLGEDRAS